ncbi:NACHT domain-containing protein [Streptomyces sp. NPDC051963]|uniref:NACHT domain-containing protein n=1 Tax=Streptomyces sp. NPDC051963 TaxID=3365678 RepID=UPI0037D6E78D
MEQQDSPTTEFVVWLVHLRARAGHPSLMALSEQTARVPHPYHVAKSTMGKVFQGSGLPSLDVAVAVAGACAQYADWGAARVAQVQRECRQRWAAEKAATEAASMEAARKAVSFVSADLDFISKYQQSVVPLLDTMELFGVTLSHPDFQYRMSTSYISLTVEERGSGGRVGDGPQRVENALGGSTRVLLRGDAGSGKTTLLKWLAVGSMLRTLPGPMITWQGLVPFFLPLRRFSEGELPRPHEFMAYAGRIVAEQAPSGFVAKVLEQGRGLVLIDGVDELHADRRHEVHAWLRELTGAYRNCHYVITSRQAAVTELWLSDQRFDSFELALMSSGDQNQFIRHWHGTMREAAGSEEQQQRLTTHEHALIRSLARRRELRRLAGNPLLCALLCALHWDRAMHLPDDRMKLYEAALDMLLIRRDQHRGIDDGGPPLRSGVREMLLRRLAYWMIRNDRSEVSFQEFVELIRGYLETSVHEPPDADLVARQLLVRTGLLRSPATGRVDFVHRTFQEYLAAEQLLNERDLDFLVSHAHQDQWQEVVVMTSGRARDRERNELIGALLKRADDELHHRLSLTILAVDCVTGAASLDPELRREAGRRAAELIPPQSIEQATALAGLGEVALDLMPGPEAGLRPDVVNAIIHTCRLVGGASAMRALARFVPDATIAVERQLRTMWAEFDPSEFARVVLSPLRWEDPLRVGPAFLAHVGHLTHLQELRVSGPADSYAVLGRLAELRWLAIDEPQPSLPHLIMPPSLRTLHLEGAVEHQAFLGLAQRGLEELSLGGAPCPDCKSTPWQMLAQWPDEVRRGVRSLTAEQDVIDSPSSAIAQRLPALTWLRIKRAWDVGPDHVATYLERLEELPSVVTFEMELSADRTPSLSDMVSAFPHWRPRRGRPGTDGVNWVFIRAAPRVGGSDTAGRNAARTATQASAAP